MYYKKLKYKASHYAAQYQLEYRDILPRCSNEICISKGTSNTGSIHLTSVDDV
jgi:hypothetical protein